MLSSSDPVEQKVDRLAAMSSGLVLNIFFPFADASNIFIVQFPTADAIHGVSLFYTTTAKKIEES